MRSFGQMLGRGHGGGGADLGNPSPGIIPGVRTTPNVYEPAPNAEPVGADTGAPPRTQFFSRLVVPASTTKDNATLLVLGTPENRVALITAPAVGFTVYIGDSGVSPDNGAPLTPGVPYEAILPGLQPLYAVTDAPVYLRVGVQVAIVLAAERQRKTDGL
jgi:hypothetical protein